ncbi:TRAP transporter substrate-binding protein [bacterium D16-54]|nr:TRAP transporter substrate-binding protein [bacterium D16-54]RKJ14364.1 TRAP transporter substrate-binding protein [bacterium D16-56]
MKKDGEGQKGTGIRTLLAFWGVSILLSGSSLTGCSPSGSGNKESRKAEPDLVLCYGEVNPEGHIMTDSAQYFADEVERLSQGRIVVEIYPSGQMGDDKQCYRAMQMGSLDLYRGNSASLADCGNPMVSALALPYIFRDREHFWKVCESELGQEILDDIQVSAKGMKGIAYLDEGARNFFTTEQPVTRIEDMKNLKIRMQLSGLMEDTVAALGAQAVPIAYVELYTALQSGSVDGAENPPVSYYYNKFYEVAPYYVKDGHTYAPGVILISEITWNALKEEEQQVILKAARLTQDYNRAEIEKADQKAYQALERAGVEILELEDPEAWSDAVEPVYQKYGAQFLDLIGQVRSMK